MMTTDASLKPADASRILQEARARYREAAREFESARDGLLHTYEQVRPALDG